MDLVVSGTDEAILMVECGADYVTEAEVLDALDIAHAEIKKLCGAFDELAQKAGKEKREFEAPSVDEGLIEKIKDSHGSKLEEATQVPEKLARQDAIKAVEEDVLETYALPARETRTTDAPMSSKAFAKVEKDMIRHRIAVDKKRPDGRAQDEIRPIETEVDIAPRVHGSALFTRGETQILSNVALGTTRMDMKVDNLGLQEKKTFFHHYNFPPFSVGEAGFMRGPKRRDIGHGALAERALSPTIPGEEEFPYVVRVVSETLESNGSSSMGSVCASSMALQAAGVPVESPVAGVAMGLIKEGDDYIVLTDIAGVEDHLGDMDFKVAGSEDGITALQMDIKITGVTFDILRDALEQARQGRLFILGKMAEAIDAPREQMSEHAPRIETIQIDTEKIGAVIGKGGETIRGMQEEFEAEIDIDDDGSIRVYAPTGCPGRRLHRAHRGDDARREDRRRVQGQGREDDHLRRVRRARQGHRRPASHLEREAGRAGRHGRGRPEPGRRDRRDRGRGRPRARPNRPAALRGPLRPGQDARGARRSRRRLRWRRRTRR